MSVNFLFGLSRWKKLPARIEQNHSVSKIIASITDFPVRLSCFQILPSRLDQRLSVKQGTKYPAKYTLFREKGIKNNWNFISKPLWRLKPPFFTDQTGTKPFRSKANPSHPTYLDLTNHAMPGIGESGIRIPAYLTSVPITIRSGERLVLAHSLFKKLRKPPDVCFDQIARFDNRSTASDNRSTG